jgi:hypothetical protein
MLYLFFPFSANYNFEMYLCFHWLDKLNLSSIVVKDEAYAVLIKQKQTFVALWTSQVAAIWDTYDSPWTNFFLFAFFGRPLACLCPETQLQLARLTFSLNSTCRSRSTLRLTCWCDASRSNKQFSAESVATIVAAYQEAEDEDETM